MEMALERVSVVSDRSQEPSPREPSTRPSPSRMVQECDQDDDDTLPSRSSQAPSEFSLPRSLFSIDTRVSQTSKKRTRRRDPLNDVGLTSAAANGGYQRQERDFRGVTGTLSNVRRTDPLLGQEIQPTPNRESPISCLDPSMNTAALNTANFHNIAAPARSASGTLDASQASVSVRSATLLPAASSLKQSFQDTQHRLVTLQEEHSELNSAYANLQNLYGEQGVALRNGVQELQDVRNRYHVLTEEHKAATEQYQSHIQQLQERLDESDSALQLLESEKDQLARALDQSSTLTQTDLKRVQKENDSLKSGLKDAMDKLKRYASLEEENKRLQGKVSKSIQTIETKDRTIRSLEDDLSKINDAYKEKIKKLKEENKVLSNEVVSAKKQASATKENSQGSVLELKTHVEVLERENREKDQLYVQTSQQKSRLESELAEAELASRKSAEEMTSLSKQLEEAKEEVQIVRGRNQSSMAEARTAEANDTKIKSLELENDKLRAIQKENIRQYQNELRVKAAEIVELKAQNQRARQDVEDAKGRCHQVEATLQSLETSKEHKLTMDIGCQTTGSLDQQRHGPIGRTSTFPAESILEGPPFVTRLPRVDSYLSTASQTIRRTSSRVVPDRGGHFREVAERVQLDYQFQREMNRLRNEHESDLVSLTTKHENVLKQVTQDAKSEASAKAKDYKRRLQSEYESEIEELCRKHDEQIAQIKRQYEAERDRVQQLNNEIAVELQAAGQDLEYADQSRAALEEQVSNLESQLANVITENKIWRDKLEVLSHNHGKKSDFVELLARIRTECIAAFDRHQMQRAEAVAQGSTKDPSSLLHVDNDILRTVSSIGDRPSYQLPPSPPQPSKQSIWRNEEAQRGEVVHNHVSNLEAMLLSLD